MFYLKKITVVREPCVLSASILLAEPQIFGQQLIVRKVRVWISYLLFFFANLASFQLLLCKTWLATLIRVHSACCFNSVRWPSSEEKLGNIFEKVSCGHWSIFSRILRLVTYFAVNLNGSPVCWYCINIKLYNN